MIWFRMGRFEDALRDLEVVLDSAPSIAQSRFLLGIVLKRLGRDDDASKDLILGLHLDASIDGIKPVTVSSRNGA
jgi:Flp pilus assembly protein TadD